MEDIIYKTILENLTIVIVESGGGEDTAIAIKGTHENYYQDDGDMRLEAKYLAADIVKKIAESKTTLT